MSVSNAEYIKVIFDSYFEQLLSILDAMKDVRTSVESARGLKVKDRIKAEHLMTKIEEQLASYAENLSKTGIEIIRKCS